MCVRTCVRVCKGPGLKPFIASSILWQSSLNISETRKAGQNPEQALSYSYHHLLPNDSLHYFNSQVPRDERNPFSAQSHFKVIKVSCCYGRGAVHACTVVRGTRTTVLFDLTNELVSTIETSNGTLPEVIETTED